jgi:hypothetical protein
MLIILDQIILIVLGFFVVIESKSLLRLTFYVDVLFWIDVDFC